MPSKIAPWAFPQIRIEPIGLRECVLRVHYMDITQVRTLADRMTTALLNRVARWRLQQPERFAELHSLVRGER